MDLKRNRKFKAFLASLAAGLVVGLGGAWIGVDRDIIRELLQFIMGLGGAFMVGQGFADGFSKGATSRTGKEV